MNSLNAVYFPGTDLYSIRQYPIFLLFQKMHLIRPVEDDSAGSGEESSDSFIKSGFCQVHTPCPLGENRDRFVHLVADISRRKDDYAAQLSSLILAGTSSLSAQDDDSERAIRSSLFSPDAEKVKVMQEDKDSKLWQARLVLAIAEILDREEEEIARNLAMLEDDQAELFKELHGDIDELEENPFAELSRLESNLGAANSGNMKKRCNAWKTLFLEGNMGECEIFLTTSQDAGDLLLESYEKKTNQPALLAATLALPGLIGWNSAEAYQSVLKFRDQNSELLLHIHAYLNDLMQQDTCTQQDTASTAFTALAEQWHGQLETIFPTEQFGRIPVKCYVFPGLSCATLIGTTRPENSAAKNGLLIVVD
ncbi:hypothetical protein [Desulfocastanea catecholica]